MSKPQPVLSIREARKAFGKTPALRSVSLDLYPGELLGFLGPNGAGKTTLIRCLSGRSRLDGGTFRFDEQATRRGLGIVPQSLAIYEDLTAQQNLVAFGRLHGVPGRQLRESVRSALQWSNLYARRRQLVRTFSGGMKRRLNIACSVLHRPLVLLLDEPTVGVDPQSRERIYGMLDELRDRGTAILLTTHQLDEAQYRCDRIAIVDQGRVIQVGTFAELVTSTVGRHQQLRVTFGSPPEASVAPLSLDGAGTTGTCVLKDVGQELPRIMQTLQACDRSIDHVVLQGPTLQDVFLSLTGRDLRE
jgi:ABC-2 type transport system ATP-binding protein